MNKNFYALCAMMVALAILIVSYGEFVVKRTTGVFAEDAPVKTVYLTFDDGPSDRVTPKILDILAEENVCATFFIVGINAETRKYLVEREHREGHTVAVHSYTHDYAEIYASADSLIRDIDKCNRVIKSVTGEYSTLYRFPGGSYGLSQRLIDAVTGHGMRYIDWNASTRDAEIYNATPYALYRAAVESAEQYDNVVLLSHDSTTKTATVDALRDIIRYFRHNGYVFKAF